MPDLLLLGAGASVDAGLPTSFGITEILSRATALPEPGRRGGSSDDLARALAFAIGTLYQQRGANGINPIKRPGIDIEELVDAIDSLAHPERSGMTPFISGWHPFLRDIDAAHEDRGQIADDFVERLQAIPQAESPARAAEVKDLAAAHLKMLLLLSQPKFASVLFGRLKAAIVRRLGAILWLSGDDVAGKVRYMLPVVTSPATACIATLNYDNTVESCALAAGVPLSVGIEDYGSRGELYFPDSARLRLLKLHGSLDWQFPEDRADPRKYDGAEALRFGSQRVQPGAAAWDPAALGVVFGRHKMQAAGPFLELLHRFTEELRAVDRLVAVGYSFRDHHINRAVAQFLIRSETNRLLIIDPHLPNEYQIILDLMRRFPGRVKAWNVTAAKAFESYPISPSFQGGGMASNQGG